MENKEGPGTVAFTYVRGTIHPQQNSPQQYRGGAIHVEDDMETYCMHLPTKRKLKLLTRGQDAQRNALKPRIATILGGCLAHHNNLFTMLKSCRLLTALVPPCSGENPELHQREEAPEFAGLIATASRAPSSWGFSPSPPSSSIATLAISAHLLRKRASECRPLAMLQVPQQLTQVLSV
mmetsp:Transcript_91017/g.199398  ORF Transcript_91017/g.199398 Transcript_91017/m.199398 type:complete len:179 (-) Transcript_91017:1691-2227(-)